MTLREFNMHCLLGISSNTKVIKLFNYLNDKFNDISIEDQNNRIFYKKDDRIILIYSYDLKTIHVQLEILAQMRNYYWLDNMESKIMLTCYLTHKLNITEIKNILVI